MTPNEIELIRKSFAKVAPIADAAAAIFYEKLFAYDPSVRPMFKGDISEQGKKLISVLATVVQNLDKLETIEGAVADLAVRHVSYGVVPQHYETVGRALIDTLEAGLGDAFTPEVRSAWIGCYGAISAKMIAATAGGRS